MPDLKRAYLFTGDDEVKIDQARRRLAERAERDGASFEALSADACTPQNFANAITSPSLLPGTRIVLADGVESWRAADVDPAVSALESLAEAEFDAVAVLICRKKPLKAIASAIDAVGGELREFKPPSESELPQWLIGQAEALGVQMDSSAASLLVETVGKPGKRVAAAKNWSQKRRLLSELEKLAAAAGPGEVIDRSLIERCACGETSAEMFALTDAALAGDRLAAVTEAERLLAGGEPAARISAMLVRTFGQAQAAAGLIEAGRGGEIADQLGVQPWVAKKLSSQAKLRGDAALRAAVIDLAVLDDAIKGGSAIDGETATIRAVATIASG